MRLTLASASPARREILRRAGIAHTVCSSAVDEAAVLAAAHRERGPLAIRDQVGVLARAKALDVAERLEDAHYTVGCDSLFELDGVVVGKPGTRARARARLKAMAGQTGTLWTGHCLAVRRGTRLETYAAERATRVTIAPLSATEIEAYLATGEPLNVAGSFTIDGYGGAFIDRIEGDHLNVIGLSLPVLRELLAEAGTALTDFWQARPAEGS
ncbi:MAG: nucleoside triphosphate pyrophosphatase [Bowdeniella nasicola]|nr:nucleoside triphosphate pyrophosphatase [Bowdeniella nasicola]